MTDTSQRGMGGGMLQGDVFEDLLIIQNQLVKTRHLISLHSQSKKEAGGNRSKG